MQKVASYILLKCHYEFSDISMTKKSSQLADYQPITTLQGRRGNPF